MVLRVADHRRTSARRVYRRAAFAWVCVEFLVLLERERDTSLAREGARLHMARLVNLAMNRPAGLAEEQRALADRAGLLLSPDEAHAAGADILAQVLAAGWLSMDAPADAPADASADAPAVAEGA